MKDKAKDEPIEFVKMIVTQMTKGKASIQEFEDLVGEGLLGLVDAQKRFDPSKANGAKFSTYAEWRVRGQVLDSIRQRRGRTGQKDIVELYEPHDEESRSLEEITEAGEYTDPDERLIVLETIKALPEREQVVLDLALKGYSLEEIGDSISVTPSRVSQLHSLIEEKINMEPISNERKPLQMPEPSIKGKAKDPLIVERQRKVIELYNQTSPQLTAKQIAEKLNLTLITVNNDLHYLKRRAEGRTRSGQKIRQAVPATVPPPKYIPSHTNISTAQNKIDFRDEVANILRRNNIPKAKISIILGLIDL